MNHWGALPAATEVSENMRERLGYGGAVGDAHAGAFAGRQEASHRCRSGPVPVSGTPAVRDETSRHRTDTTRREGAMPSRF